MTFLGWILDLSWIHTPKTKNFGFVEDPNLFVFVLVKTHNYINKSVWKTLLTNGCDNGLTTLHYMGSETCWIANRQDKHSSEGWVSLAPIKKIVTLVLPSTFVDMFSLYVYHRIQKHCACPNCDAIPQYLRNRKTISISHVWVVLCELCKHPLSWHQITL